MTMHSFFRCLAGAVLLLSAHAVSAQQAPAPQTPSQVLGQYPNGGPDMITQVQSLMNADRGNLAAIIAYARAATEDQRKAIAQGLANVAKGYAANDPGFVNTIARAVADAGLPEFAKAYAEAAGDTGTASVGGGGGGGGPTAAGPPTGGANTGSTIQGSRPVVTTFGLTGGGSTSSIGGSASRF